MLVMRVRWTISPGLIFFKKEDNISQKLINPLDVLGCFLPLFGILEEIKSRIEKPKGYFLRRGNPDLNG